MGTVTIAITIKMWPTGERVWTSTGTMKVEVSVSTVSTTRLVPTVKNVRMVTTDLTGFQSTHPGPANVSLII